MLIAFVAEVTESNSIVTFDGEEREFLPPSAESDFEEHVDTCKETTAP